MDWLALIAVVLWALALEVRLFRLDQEQAHIIKKLRTYWWY